MIQQQRVQCDNCNGTGQAISARDRCKTCNGNKTVSEGKILKVEIDKGMKEGLQSLPDFAHCSDKKIYFRGESNEEPGCVTGDVIFVIKEAEHELFQRDGPHLIMQKDIPLVNALTGVSFNITHLDGRILHITTPKGDIIKHGAVREIPEEGMPVCGSPFTKGSLYIKFNVIFPTHISPKNVQTLKKALPGDGSEPMPVEGTEEVTLEPVNEERLQGQYARSSANAYDESSEEEEGQGGVSCQQQ